MLVDLLTRRIDFADSASTRQRLNEFISALAYSQNSSLFILKTIMTTRTISDNLVSGKIVPCCHSCPEYKRRQYRQYQTTLYLEEIVPCCHSCLEYKEDNIGQYRTILYQKKLSLVVLIMKNSAINPININEGNYFNYSHWFQWSKGNKSA